MDRYQNLVGKRFRRNKYGLSDWIQTVQNINVIHNMQHGESDTIIVFGDGNNIWGYTLDEIQFIE